MLQGLVIKGAYSGVETLITPDGPDVLDGGGGVEGIVGEMACVGFVGCGGLSGASWCR
jgi:hypothetical protein